MATQIRFFMICPYSFSNVTQFWNFDIFWHMHRIKSPEQWACHSSCGGQRPKALEQPIMPMRSSEMVLFGLALVRQALQQNGDAKRSVFSGHSVCLQCMEKKEQNVTTVSVPGANVATAATFQTNCQFRNGGTAGPSKGLVFQLLGQLRQSLRIITLWCNHIATEGLLIPTHPGAGKLLYIQDMIDTSKLSKIQCFSPVVFLINSEKGLMQASTSKHQNVRLDGTAKKDSWRSYFLGQFCSQQKEIFIENLGILNRLKNSTYHMWPRALFLMVTRQSHKPVLFIAGGFCKGFPKFLERRAGEHPRQQIPSGEQTLHNIDN